MRITRRALLTALAALPLVRRFAAKPAPSLDDFSKSNPAMIVLDLVRASGWPESEIDIPSFIGAACHCDHESGRSYVFDRVPLSIAIADVLREEAQTKGSTLRFNEAETKGIRLRFNGSRIGLSS